MSNIELVQKFRPIFIFSKGENYYPINKRFLRRNNIGTKNNIKIPKDVFKDLPFPFEPLYYHIIDEDKNRIAVAYILIFPYTQSSFFSLVGTRCNIASCVVVIDKNTKTLSEIYYWNSGRSEFKTKTSRPVVYISANEHKFLKELNKNERGLRWEPYLVEDFDLKSLKNKKIESKGFDCFLKNYNL